MVASRPARSMIVCMALATIGLGCTETGSSAADSAAVAGSPEQPTWLLLGWETTLSIAPDPHAPALRLIAPEPNPDASPGRVVKVIGTGPDGWWQVQTASQAEVGAAGEVIEGLDVYALTLYVPIGTGTPLAAAPTPAVGSATSDILIQTGEPRGSEVTVEWRISEGTDVYWPDGSVAGQVRHTHAFVNGDSATTNGKLVCFDARVGPPRIAATRLCFESTAVTKALHTPEPGLLGDSGDQFGDQFGDQLEPGHAMTGTGVQNGAPSYDSGLADLTPESIGAGYGATKDKLPDIELEPIQTQGPDREVVRKRVRWQANDIRHCYHELVKRDPTATGKLTLALTIAADGTTAVKVSSFDADLGDCVRERVERWTFPHGNAGTAKVPMVLRLDP